MTTADRRSFRLRLQPYEGSLMAEVVDYLNGLERQVAQRRLEDALIMCFLAQARLYSEQQTPEARRRTCLECCDALDKHASHLRQLVGVEPPWFHSSIGAFMSGAGAAQRTTAGAAEPETTTPSAEVDPADAEPPTGNVNPPVPKPQLQGEATAAQVNALFGD